ncbi:hypothetical protein C0Q70_10616 [Pomacea canaliculata]|uniref:BHLH domain-containing protein n=1 Tax=Pomacea canaliculata TaxID=400727 RepID=A0A2T7P3N1_POMCA|nr:hypothetical protein C0Q70_10616 [Pomacea canaliculata]
MASAGEGGGGATAAANHPAHGRCLLPPCDWPASQVGGGEAQQPGTRLKLDEKLVRASSGTQHLLCATEAPPGCKRSSCTPIPVRAIPVPNTNKLILAGPCIVLRTATVAEALRQERKLEAAITTTTASSTTTNSSTSTTPAALTHRTAASKTPQSPELLRCKRRADIGRLGFPEAKPASVSRRNARERNRVKLVNLGFETLREHVPNGKKNRKMSKVETLRSAVEYIRQMQQMLRNYDAETGSVTEKVLINIDDSDNTIGGGCSSSDEDNGMCGEIPLVLAPAGAATSVPATIVADASTTTCATTTVGVAPVVTTIGGYPRHPVWHPGSPSETSSESSYEYYEALEGSLEEDLQDISNWITELCSAQDMQAHGEY